MLWLHGFLDIHIFAAWQPQMVISACQWFGVAMEMASRFLSSSALRTSCKVCGAEPPLLRPGVLLEPFGVRPRVGVNEVNNLDAVHFAPFADMEPPRLLRPATAMRMVSLAPSTRPLDLVPAMVTVAAAARVDLRNVRRDWTVIG